MRMFTESVSGAEGAHTPIVTNSSLIATAISKRLEHALDSAGWAGE